jgi:hypothetical protein
MMVYEDASEADRAPYQGICREHIVALLDAVLSEQEEAFNTEDQNQNEYQVDVLKNRLRC